MKALSIRQPWAWAILHAGKDVENREWSNGAHMHAAMTMVQKGGATILIHASGTMTRADYEGALATIHKISEARPFPAGLRLPKPDDLERGGFVGTAFLCDVVTAHASPWFFGPVGLVLRDVKPLPFRYARGQLGLWEAER